MKNLFWIVCTVALFASCQEDVTEGKKQYPQEKVSMGFALQAGGMSQPEYGRAASTRSVGKDGLEVTFGPKPGTRAVETLPIESVMKDLMVMQFDGEGDDAALMGTPQYFPQYDAEPATMSFIASKGDRHTIYFVANGGKDLGPDITGKTLGDFKRMVHDIPVEIKLVEGQGVLMTGAWVGPISNDADVKEVILTRAMAKISFHLTNNLPGDRYIQSVSVENVPASVNYTGLTDNTLANQLYYPTKTYDGEDKYIWYIPENLNTAQEKSTYVMITVGIRTSTMVYPCRIYLNSTDDNPDYTLKRNHSYGVSVTLRGTSSIEGELLVDCHYVRGDVQVETEAVVESDADWIDVSNSGTWEAGLTQTVTATGTTVYLHIDDNLTDTDRRATVTVTEGMKTRTIPVRQKAIRKVGLFGAPDADGIYTKTLGMEMIEENSSQIFCTIPLKENVFPTSDRCVFYSGLDLTSRYGTDNRFAVFEYCYGKNKDKSNILWYVPALAQMVALYLGQPIYGLKELGSNISGGYYSATVSKQAGASYHIFDTGYYNSQSTSDRNRNMRCVRDIP